MRANHLLEEFNPLAEGGRVVGSTIPSASRARMIKPLQRHGFESQQPPDRPSDDCERLAAAPDQRAVFTDGGGGRIDS